MYEDQANQCSHAEGWCRGQVAPLLKIAEAEGYVAVVFSVKMNKDMCSEVTCGWRAKMGHCLLLDLPGLPQRWGQELVRRNFFDPQVVCLCNVNAPKNHCSREDHL